MDDLVQISHDVGAPLLAANDSHYTYAGEADSHDVLLCIQTGANKSDQDRFQFQSQEFYIKSAPQMRSLFPADRYPGACDNTLLIAERSDVTLEFGKILLPQFPVPPGHDEESYLRELVMEGARQRYGDSLRDEVRERIDYELRSSRRWGSPPTSSSCGISSATPTSAASAPARAGERRRLDRCLHASGSPSSIPLSTG